MLERFVQLHSQMKDLKEESLVHSMQFPELPEVSENRQLRGRLGQNGTSGGLALCFASLGRITNLFGLN